MGKQWKIDSIILMLRSFDAAFTAHKSGECWLILVACFNRSCNCNSWSSMDYIYLALQALSKIEAGDILFYIIA